MSAIDVTVKLSGGLFGKDIPKVVEQALVGEVLAKVDERMSRPRQGKGLGARRNRVRTRPSGLELTVTSTRIWPRTRGTAWTKKNVGVVKSMAPRVMRKAAERIAGELN
jgi:hypothetical protein